MIIEKVKHDYDNNEETVSLRNTQFYDKYRKLRDLRVNRKEKINYELVFY